MEVTSFNTFIGSIVTIVIAFIGAWIQLNKRISVLEVQVSNDHESLKKVKENIEDIKNMLVDIKVGVQHLQDVKADKK